MKSVSLYMFIALGALLISCSSAAPTYDLAALGKELLKRLVSSTEQAEAETSVSAQAVESQEDVLIQKTVAGIQSFLEGVNEVLAEQQQDDGYGDDGYADGYQNEESNANAQFIGTILSLIPTLLG